MGNIRTEYFFAARLSQSSGGGNGVMTRIATMSVAVGLAVMIVALGVIFGFKREISEKISGFTSHVQIRHYDGNSNFETVPISAEQPFLGKLPEIEGFAGMNRYALRGGMMKGKTVVEGILLKGVGDDYDWSFFENNLTEGEIPRVGDSVRTRDLLISRGLASLMQAGVGDRVELMFVQTPPRNVFFRIAGIFDTEWEEMDNIMALTDIRNVQNINGWDYGQITGYEIMSDDLGRIGEFSDEIFDALNSMGSMIEDELMVINLRQNNPVMFDWLDTHNLNALIIIVIMLLVAGFNMIAAILIILMEKTSMIGVLKALGMTDRSIQKIFIVRSSHIILRGMLWGNAAGIAVCLLQKYTGLVKLTSEGYFLARIPIFIDWGHVLLLNAGIFCLLLISQAIPTTAISKISPEKSIRFE